MLKFFRKQQTNQYKIIGIDKEKNQLKLKSIKTNKEGFFDFLLMDVSDIKDDIIIKNDNSTPFSFKKARSGYRNRVLFEVLIMIGSWVLISLTASYFVLNVIMT